MKVLICVLAGYLLGCISPSYMISKIKQMDLRKEGSGNLGATNTYIYMGKGWGILVLLCDLSKAILAIKLTAWLFPEMRLAGVITGCAAIIGHIFPFYLRFKGGKGLACLAGMMMELDFPCFLFLLVTSLILIVIVNWGIASAFYAPTMFTVLYSVKNSSWAAFLIMAFTSVCMMWRHRGNLKSIQEGNELSVRDFFSKYKKSR